MCLYSTHNLPTSLENGPSNHFDVQDELLRKIVGTSLRQLYVLSRHLHYFRKLVGSSQFDSELLQQC
jgi:hypothetical protein